MHAVATVLAAPAAIGLIVNAKETQGPPELGGVADTITVVAETGAAVASQGTLHKAHRGWSQPCVMNIHSMRQARDRQRHSFRQQVLD